MKFNFRNTLGFSLFAITQSHIVAQPAKPAKSKPNVLFIVVDDLKPLMSAYGDKIAITPGLDKLAREGIAVKLIGVIYCFIIV